MLANRRGALRNTRFASCPPSLVTHYWSAPVLRVLEKATQTRPDNRYQTVQEFWDDLAEAALPKTKRLGETEEPTRIAHEGRKPSALDLTSTGRIYSKRLQSLVLSRCTQVP